jgi:cytochrome c
MKKGSGLFILILALFFLSSTVIPQGGDPDNGAELYAQKCARCHGSAGEDGSAPSHRNCSICDSFEALFEKIDSEMPRDNPQDCRDTCAYDTAAFIFVNLNGHSLDSSTSSDPGTEDEGGGCLISISTE